MGLNRPLHGIWSQDELRGADIAYRLTSAAALQARLRGDAPVGGAR